MAAFDSRVVKAEPGMMVALVMVNTIADDPNRGAWRAGWSGYAPFAAMTPIRSTASPGGWVNLEGG
jgi:hypothetical protein